MLPEDLGLAPPRRGGDRGRRRRRGTRGSSRDVLGGQKGGPRDAALANAAAALVCGGRGATTCADGRPARRRGDRPRRGRREARRASSRADPRGARERSSPTSSRGSATRSRRAAPRCPSASSRRAPATPPPPRDFEAALSLRGRSGAGHRRGEAGEPVRGRDRRRARRARAGAPLRGRGRGGHLRAHRRPRVRRLARGPRRGARGGGRPAPAQGLRRRSLPAPRGARRTAPTRRSSSSPRSTDDALRAPPSTTARALGLAALVEVHDDAEVERALAAGARIVGVNNREPRAPSRSTSPSPSGSCRALPADVRGVAESGVRTAEDARRLRRAGAANLLVGEALVRAADPGGAPPRADAGVTDAPCA